MKLLSELRLYCVQIGEDLFFITVIILILRIDVSRHEDPLCNSVHQEFTDLGVAVLASLGGGHLNNLAGSAFQDNKAVFAQGRTLHGVGGGCPSITSLEIQLCICHACCRGQRKESKEVFVLSISAKTESSFNLYQLNRSYQH